MNALSIEIVSQETIKPLSATSHHLKTLKLSLIDQYVPPVYVPLILFFSASDDATLNPVDRLKKSLPEFLTHFYPLAGRISDNQSIQCNDEGVNFFETRVNTHLAQVLSHPVPADLDQLLPRDSFDGSGPKPLLSIQSNMFQCGGMALGVYMSHKLADASSLGLFISGWATYTRSPGDKFVCPKFDTSSFFPPKDVASATLPLETQKVVRKRFVFNNANVAALRARCSNNLYVEHPTRVEAVSALIWRCAMNAARSRSGSAKLTSGLNLAVNLRSRMVPALSNSWVGNLVICATAKSTTENLPDLQFLVGRLREAVSNFDSDYVRKLQVDNGFSELFDSRKEVAALSRKGEMSLFVISSWCRFPFYEVDFGWGKPAWVTSIPLAPGIIILTDTTCGNGVEAWVALNEEEMGRFECHTDLIAFTDAV